jgi:4,5-DOPA dioxygenase extradiol
MIPALFLNHGSPMLAVEESDYTEFLKCIGQEIQPKAIVIFTAHWESPILTISSINGKYETIYDFGGFPQELYQIQYPAKGLVQLASRLQIMFASKGISTRKDIARGLDHGSWVLLSRMYPQADIPVVQVSVNPYLSPNEQFAIGKAIQGLGQEDILVIGSGATVHNLRALYFGQTTPEPWAVEFDEWIIDKIIKKDTDSLFAYKEKAPHARLAIPREEHLVPLFIAMGSGTPETKPELLFRGKYEFGTFSYTCFAF